MTDTFVYDGDCAFCTMCARFLERWIPTKAVVIPWQFADLTTLRLTRAECVEAVQWSPAEGPTAAGPVAIARLLGTSTAPWRLAGRVLGLRPVTAVAWPLYRWVARNRHRLPGGTAACAIPANSPAAPPPSP
ncbi:DCC1-like thiol-disulfide oxidoreductase family protein [Asanoa sp. WMMD1127]|uniref:thiol-disulfide oxidoreductase DCC family protein n=1 Tax=Asanoa sp. WMMD1127 TaxID=3016107 RepID=UPI00241652DE|nr:DCC1-like thiol-disulfide oxidoreductase family protein [Asanoa sp. WMMD1127]MDG4823196.1 DCC1-like thiol-disulfide oxidoreductase family protein [Asanoa sp. WMMD1127]